MGGAGITVAAGAGLEAGAGLGEAEIWAMLDHLEAALGRSA